MIKFVNNSEPDITDENLNKMQQDIGTVVSATEPQGDERLKVWIQKGKNWFNKNDLKITNAWQVTYTIDENKDINIKVSQTGGVCFVGTNNTYLKAGTYTFSATTTGQLSEIRVYNAKDNSQILTNSSNSFTLTLEEDAMIYFQFYVFSTSLSNSLKVSEIQIEQGTGKTSYEAYIEPKIYVLNNNGVYEEFVKENENEYITTNSENETNQFIDGKRVYRKRISTGTLPNNTFKNISTGLTNVDIIKIEGLVKNSSGSIFPLPFVTTSGITNNIQVNMTSNGSNIQISAGIDRSSYSGYVDIYYIKTAASTTLE